MNDVHNNIHNHTYNKRTGAVCDSHDDICSYYNSAGHFTKTTFTSLFFNYISK